MLERTGIAIIKNDSDDEGIVLFGLLYWNIRQSSSSGSLQKTKESITREKNHRSIQLMKMMEYFLKDRNLNSMINRKDNMFQLSQVYSKKVELAL